MSLAYYGGLWTRVCAAIIDVVVVAIFSILIYMSVGINLFDESFSHPRRQIGTLLSLGFLFFYFTIFQAQFKGSIGKHTMGLVLVDAKSLCNIGIDQAMRRFLTGIFSSPLFLLGLISLERNKRKQGWHDRIAETLVVKRELLRKLREKEKIFSAEEKEVQIHTA